ncbi:VOC family protein [Phormidium sp. LEGE 05292]|uniref:VOC family protein n=1 Tax=[Phormidium] sp. LEGE 05292 TaxID=767427 RepID=UPI0018807620|nr:VOC family protein [Phormidium sp. LEGE 05292]MBE9227948.1 VOC family protein [Phormidium sp. LEGE 05292]
MNTAFLSPIQTQRIEAIALTVADIDRSINFYTKALGFEVIDDGSYTENSYGKIRVVTLKLCDEKIRFIQYFDKVGKPIPQDSQSNDLWFQHLAIVVSDMDEAYNYLKSFPFEAISTAPQTIPPENKEAAYIQAFKFRDPDGHPLELIWFPPDKGQQKWQQKSDKLFLGIDHTAIAVANTEQSLQFYCDFLGMKIDGGSFNSGETQAKMDGLPDAKVRITALRPIQGGLGIELLDYIKPENDRPIPPDLKTYDIASSQIELIIDEAQFRQNKIQLENFPFLHHKSYRIQDPTGHFLLLIPKA